ncbi:MAG: lysophospholipid acyltransferase family protein [Anaeromyxobacteraceae bacterium]
MKIIVRAAAVLAYTATVLALVVWPPMVAVVLLVTFPFDRNRAVAGRLLRLCGAFVSRSFPFWRIRIEGRWPAAKGAYVVVANHNSFLDIFVLSNLPHEMKWLAKRSLFQIPWVGWAFRLVGDIAVERGDPASAVAVMEKARDYLAHGMSVMIFPEGTRSKDGNLLPFKAGAFKLALDAGVPILPIAITGTAQGMPKGTPWVRPTRIVVRILDPVPTVGLVPKEAAGSREEVRALTRLRDEVRGRITAALASSPDAAPPVATVR